MLPNWQKVHALVSFTKDSIDPVIVALSLQDENHLTDGTDLTIVQDYLESQDHVIAYDINCTHPNLVTPTLVNFNQHIHDHKPLIAFPNSSNSYNTEIKEWNDDALTFAQFDALIKEWFNLGLQYVGGCCCMSEEQEKHIYDKFFA